MENEISLSGALHEAADEIIKVRAKARAEHGWIMDIYILRRPARR
jgi:precorrin-6A synthase